MTESRTFETPQGPARLVAHRSKRPIANLLLSHGAGGGIDAADLAALAHHLPGQGISVLLLEQPWRVAGRKIAGSPASLDVALRSVADQIRPRTPLVVGGRSAGARSAARCARELGASGCLALSFPLHPPGKPEKSRVDELTGSRVPTLVIQGERDPFGRPEEFPDGTEMAVVPAADHAFKVPKSAPLSQADALSVVVEATLEWIVREIARS
ncbi:alpha/beta family hydrolase [Nocardioides sp.]|uniref:alpha/beta hydrolase family protein n=1 Tax=Nocardioides sp. TaxID=35761 RepID=UPI002BB3D88F|nr:alpha/beta family hydrolase [Nocardioides sp.]HSX66122.1 alpha/beta family hydrolase [Nocardioides sp.]